MDSSRHPEEYFRRLENVLNDGDAVQAFLCWARSEEAESPLRFHYSVIAFKEMIKEKDRKTPQLAVEIYRNYLDPEKGTCQFIDAEIRRQIGHRLSAGDSVDSQLFDSVLPFVNSFLQKQHSQFIHSDVYLHFINSLHDHHSKPKSKTTKTTKKRLNEKLTSETLLRSQHEREQILGKTSVEKMYPKAVNKYPYVGMATTSKNDSAVSSNFSDHSSFGGPLRRQTRIEKSENNFRHETEEGRNLFAEILSNRLSTLDEQRNRSDRMNEQIKIIDKRTITSARELVMSSVRTFVGTGVGGDDEEEDLNNYVRQRMGADESGKPSPSQQIQSPSDNRRRRSSKSDSPDQRISLVTDGTPIMLSALESTESRGYVECDEDTSGICSNFSSNSLPFKQKAFQKMRELSNRRRIPDFSATMPRQRVSEEQADTMKISFRSSSGVPVVAFVPRRQLTFREFRRYLSISSKTRKQFFFKSKCDEAPYQLLLVDEDSALLPFFDGAIAAECRSLSDSE